MRTISLSGKRGGGLFAIVDDEDYDLVAPFKWFLTPEGYAVRSIGRRSERIGQVRRMHRLILGLGYRDPRQGDHKNGDRLDNRRSTNLRVCTEQLNHQNQRARRGSSAFRGVYFCKFTGRWCAQITVNYKTRTIGRFDDELDAARAAQTERIRLMPFTVEEAIA